MRLGEHNLNTVIDCEQLNSGPRCADPVLNMNVESVVRHPDFNVREEVSDDLALVRLADDVNFTRTYLFHYLKSMILLINL